VGGARKGTDGAHRKRMDDYGKVWYSNSPHFKPSFPALFIQSPSKSSKALVNHPKPHPKILKLSIIQSPTLKQSKKYRTRDLGDMNGVDFITGGEVR
jgi:hypothetical protein